MVIRSSSKKWDMWTTSWEDNHLPQITWSPRFLMTGLSTILILFTIRSDINQYFVFRQWQKYSIRSYFSCVFFSECFDSSFCATVTYERDYPQRLSRILLAQKRAAGFLSSTRNRNKWFQGRTLVSHHSFLAKGKPNQIHKVNSFKKENEPSQKTDAWYVEKTEMQKQYSFGEGSDHQWLHWLIGWNNCWKGIVFAAELNLRNAGNLPAFYVLPFHHYATKVVAFQ